MTTINNSTVTVEAAAYAAYTVAHNAAMRGGSKEAARELRVAWVNAVWAVHAASSHLWAAAEAANPTGKAGAAHRVIDEGKYARLRAEAVAFDEAAAAALEVSPDYQDPDLE